jgi:hypothetical protein
MGSERAVTRWHLHYQTILNEIASLKAALARSQEQGSGPTGERPQTDDHTTDLEQRLRIAQEKLYQLGPCPKPMMG